MTPDNSFQPFGSEGHKGISWWPEGLWNKGSWKILKCIHALVGRFSRGGRVMVWEKAGGQKSISGGVPSVHGRGRHTSSTEE